MTKVHQKCFPVGGLLAWPVVGILGEWYKERAGWLQRPVLRVSHFFLISLVNNGVPTFA